MWQDFAVAVSLVLVIEGILPFLSPSGYRRAAVMAATMSDQAVRMLGLGSMLVGIGLLYIFN